MTRDQGQAQERTGLWLVGARGAISTSLLYGLSAVARGELEPTGIVTARPPWDALDLAPFDAWVLGGHDICTRDLSRAAGELVAMGVLGADQVVAGAEAAAAYEAHLRPGLLDGPDVGMADLDPRSAELGALPPREQIAALQADWKAFGEAEGLKRTVVVLLASTEAAREAREEWERLEDLEAALDAGTPQPASLLYAYAALDAGHPLVNFTPNLGASTPALRELALARGVPHAGRDGKTGETLVKSALAPMFAQRALRVLAWEGYNMLGNRDGEVLDDPAHRVAKLRNKDEVLRQLLSGSDPHTRVGIDFVPSLGDWKTAWDFIHFEGFLGARMSLQFTWQGSDSALAAPLVIDLARLAALAHARGEAGVMEHTAFFFKAPLAGGTHDLSMQYARLQDYAMQRSKTR